MISLDFKRRSRLALVVAIGVDALQIGLAPLFAGGAVAPWELLLDAAAFGFFNWCLGWHIAFVPSFAIELLPVADLAPTWTVAVLIAIRSKAASHQVRFPEK